MTISDATHVTTGKRHHATVQRQVPLPLAPITSGTTRMARANPYGLRKGPGAVGKTRARSRQPRPRTAPEPHDSTGPCVLSP
ncbi:MAG: hypothetical protein KAJ97_08185 [Acidobacteria bacterium]|nr:hypothetical protein [Acidobacteriota bacterium]